MPDDADARGRDGPASTVEEIVAEVLELQERLRAASRFHAHDPPDLDADTVAVLRDRLGEPTGPLRGSSLRIEQDATILTLATGILMERHLVDMIRAGALLRARAERRGLDPVAYARGVVRAVASRGHA